MTETLIRVQGLGLAYKQKQGWLKSKTFWALRDISFELKRGQSLAVIGHNGAGKSSLLQVLAGIIAPDAGRVQYFGTGRPAMLSLNAGLQPNLNGRDNALLTGMLLGRSRREILARLDHIREFADIGEFFDQPVNTYSTGMKARLGFAAAYELDPEVLLIDEVMGVGDADFSIKSTRVMHERLQSDRTVVLVSHSVKLVKDLCDQALWIRHGRQEMIGRAEEVVEAYLATVQ